MTADSPLARLILTPTLDVTQVCTHLGWDENDTHLVHVTEVVSIKVEHVRALQTLLIGAGQGKKILIYPAEKITLVAQQALLKLLEEPPQGTSIVVVARSRSAVLPTLRSRLAIERVGQTVVPAHDRSLWEQLWRADTRRDRLQIVDTLPTKRDECLAALVEQLALPIGDPAEVPWRERGIEVVSALRHNVTPSLCLTKLAL